jgi:hypothetical protein
MTRHLNFPLNILPRNWSSVAKQPDVLQPGLQNKKMRKKLRPNSNGALSLHAMTWNCFQRQRRLRLYLTFSCLHVIASGHATKPAMHHTEAASDELDDEDESVESAD